MHPPFCPPVLDPPAYSRCETVTMSLMQPDESTRGPVGQFTGWPAALIISGQTRSELNDIKGSSQCWRIDANSIGIAVQGQPRWGRANEPQALKVLAQAIGKGVPRKDGSKEDDANGIDGYVQLPGDTAMIAVQFVTVPCDEDYAAAVASGSSEVTLTNAEAAAWIAAALSKKQHVASPSLILALDIRHASLLSDPVIVDELLKLLPTEPAALGFKAVWLVGSAKAHCRRLA